MKKIILSLVIITGLLSFSAAEKPQNPKDQLTDKEYYSLRLCDAQKKESELTVKDCRDAYSMRAIKDAEEKELEENSDLYIFGSSKK